MSQAAELHFLMIIFSPVVVTVLHTRYWHYTAGTFFWLFVQIAYIIVHVSFFATLVCSQLPTSTSLTARSPPSSHHLPHADCPHRDLYIPVQLAHLQPQAYPP